MSDFEEKVNLLWEVCDAWVSARANEIVAQGVQLSEDDIMKIEGKVEKNINAFIGKGVVSHGEAFPPSILEELYYLLFELELKKRGVANEDQIHQYKDNGQVGLSVAEGRMTPDNAVLVMEINRAHLEKKGGKDEGVCEDCVCGKK